MSRKTTLGPGWAELFADSELEDEMGVDLLVALGHEARLRDAARALALEEHLLGVHVDETEPTGQVLRLAADDGAADDGAADDGAADDGARDAAAVVFAHGRLRVSVERHGDTLQLTQLAGAPGVTAVLDETWVPLQVGVAARADGTHAMPSTLTVLDKKGRRRQLQPEGFPRS